MMGAGRMPDYEVPEPMLNSPYDEPAEHWNIEETTRADGGEATG